MSDIPAQRHRAKELDRIARLGATPLPSPFTARVVGVSFTPTYPRNLQTLESVAEIAQERGEGIPAIIVRQPDNEADPNACAVHVPALNTLAMVGHLASPIAARLAPELDAEGTWQAEVTEVLIDPYHPDRPGINVRLWRIMEDS